MEIKDYLYAIRRRFWLPLVMAAAAGLITAGFLLIQPEQYQATATVVVPALSAHSNSTSSVTQFVSTYKDVLVSYPVVTQVASQTGEAPRDISAGLSAATATASSNIIEVTYTGPHKKSVDSVAKTAAQDALDEMLGPELSAAQREVVMSQAALDDANKALYDWSVTNKGLLFPVEDYKTQSQELSQLQVQYDEALLAHDSNRANGLSAVIKKRTDDLATLVPLVLQYQGLVQTQTSAESVHNKAEADLNSVNGLITSNHEPGTVVVRNAGHVSRVPLILRYGGVAAAVALLLSLVYIVFMEFMQPAGGTYAYSWPVGTSVWQKVTGGRSRSRVLAGGGGGVQQAPSAGSNGHPSGSQPPTA